MIYMYHSVSLSGWKMRADDITYVNEQAVVEFAVCFVHPTNVFE